MANMSYCRFRNTLEDLQDCWDNINDTDMSAAEKRARKDLIELCLTIASHTDWLGLEDEDEEG